MVNSRAVVLASRASRYALVADAWRKIAVRAVGKDAERYRYALVESTIASVRAELARRHAARLQVVA